MARTPKNTYYVCPAYQDEPVPWNPYTKGTVLSHTHLSYFGGLFAEMEKHLRAEGLTVYVTWRTDMLPSYGPDVVAVVVGDEWGLYPLYTNRVRAVFKMMGTDFPFEAAPFRMPPALTAVTAAKYVRTQMHRVPSRLQAWRDRHNGPEWTGGAPVPIFDLPIGYVNQEPLPLIPLDERQYDLYFSGSVSNARFSWYHPQYWLRTPKDVARTRLVEAMRDIQIRRTDLNVILDVKEEYVPNASSSDDADTPDRSYSEMMRDTRICPVPRGTRLETGRVYEALRYGSVLVTEPLPDRWFLNGLPGVIVHDWASLPTVVNDLLADPNRLNTLHRAALAWWDDMCSEEAMGQYVADRLNALMEEHDDPREAHLKADLQGIY